jgi:ssDNA thymidine ADP-ribosyltransferase, DarT
MSLPLQIGNPPDQTLIFHITDVGNLEGILGEGGLLPDAIMNGRENEKIGYDNIKERRLTETRIPCCGHKFVGEFVPFCFCPRTPMLFTINKGNTGRPFGCQQTIVHLVGPMAGGILTGSDWAISDVNAGTVYPTFSSEISFLQTLDWEAIRADSWSGRASQKAAEFLVADFFPWTGFHQIGCHNSKVAEQVRSLLQNQNHIPAVSVERSWYYP